MTNKLRAVGCNIFAGGFTLGVEKHFEVLAHLEVDDYGTDVFKLNRPAVPVYVGETQWPLAELRGQGVDLVYCNPPCAAWSSVGGISRGRGSSHWKDDPRPGRFARCVKLLEDLQPQVLMVESVTNAFKHGRPMMDELAAYANGLGYAVTHLLVSAHQVGGCQVRKRYLFIARKAELNLELDPPTGAENAAKLLALVADPGLVCWPKDPAAKLRWMKALEQTAPGTCFYYKYIDIFGKKLRGKPSFACRRVPLTGPMVTFLDARWSIHPTEHRPLGLNEAKVISGYPQDYRFPVEKQSTFCYLARGVMPPVGAWLAKRVSSALTSTQPAQFKVITQVVDHLTKKKEKKSHE